MDEKKLQYERMIHALRLEEATTQVASAGVDVTMQDDASDEEAGLEDEEEAVDSSGSASV
ncbi:hypothetical protein A2U01_0109522 [Trifolium medium]|uniref:Uncharacterized protein n=1 Tax=Trifolium medium TaxID=97028 RepID=A0A392VIN9_9FABA|nr:hypothetical protein [Trifolium medium]